MLVENCGSTVGRTTAADVVDGVVNNGVLSCVELSSGNVVVVIVLFSEMFTTLG